jgi:hypothetical protein
MLPNWIPCGEKSITRVNGSLSLVGGSGWTAEGKQGEDNLGPPTNNQQPPKVHA